MTRFGSWDEVTAQIAAHLHAAADGEVVIVHGHDRPAPPDAPKRGLLRNKPPLPIAVYVQYAIFADSLSVECVGNAGPSLSPTREQSLRDLGMAAPGTDGATQDNWTRDFATADTAEAAAVGVTALQIIGATPGELSFERF